MFKKPLQLILRLFDKFFWFPPIRYSPGFARVHHFFSYEPREAMLSLAFQYLRDCQMTGDYLEFGVFEGKTFSAAYHFAQMNSSMPMTFYAFDSFQGLPEIQGLDAGGHFYGGEYHCDISKFKGTLSRNRVDVKKVHIVPGWFDKVLNAETKKQLPVKKAAIVWIDCDLYESTVPVLDFITDYLQEGTILILDDWFCFKGNPDRGEQQAVKEWLTRNPSLQMLEYHKFGWHGISFLTHMR